MCIVCANYVQIMVTNKFTELSRKRLESIPRVSHDFNVQKSPPEQLRAESAASPRSNSILSPPGYCYGMQSICENVSANGYKATPQNACGQTGISQLQSLNEKCSAAQHRSCDAQHRPRERVRRKSLGRQLERSFRHDGPSAQIPITAEPPRYSDRFVTLSDCAAMTECKRQKRTGCTRHHLRQSTQAKQRTFTRSTQP